MEVLCHNRDLPLFKILPNRSVLNVGILGLKSVAITCIIQRIALGSPVK